MTQTMIYHPPALELLSVTGENAKVLGLFPNPLNQNLEGDKAWESVFLSCFHTLFSFSVWEPLS